MNPDELSSVISEAGQIDLLEKVGKVDYLSCRLDGFTDQLITRVQGAHFLPLGC